LNKPGTPGGNVSTNSRANESLDAFMSYFDFFRKLSESEY